MFLLKLYDIHWLARRYLFKDKPTVVNWTGYLFCFISAINSKLFNDVIEMAVLNKKSIP
jgi:hypothetical protein